ncbi:MAG: spermidine synthase family protein, partial [Planctomycetota bacterium]
MSSARIRLAVALTALAAVALELALMRALAIRFWHHFAAMVIAVALLGFGGSGTALVLLRKRVARRPRLWLGGTAVAFGLSVPICLNVSALIRLDINLLAWDPSQIWRILAIEALLIAPFFLAATALGVALMDRTGRVPGHYAANLIGSGLGAVGAVALMAVLPTERLLTVVSLTALAAGLVAIPWRRVAWVAAPAALIVVAVNVLAPVRLAISPYKSLPQLLAMPNVQRIYRTEGPMGQLDVLEGPGLHHAPPMSIAYTQPLPNHALLILDGEPAGAVYDCDGRGDWAFMDQTPFAASYHLRADASVLVIGAAGGPDVGLAVFHESPRIVALELNADVIAAVTGPLAERGGRVLLRPEVELIEREARGYLAQTD